MNTDDSEPDVDHIERCYAEEIEDWVQQSLTRLPNPLDRQSLARWITDPASAREWHAPPAAVDIGDRLVALFENARQELGAERAAALEQTAVTRLTEI